MDEHDKMMTAASEPSLMRALNPCPACNAHGYKLTTANPWGYDTSKKCKACKGKGYKKRSK